MIRNLLKETVECLKNFDKDGTMVLWVGSRDGKYSISWEDFFCIAVDFNYDAGYGNAEVPVDLVVVGDGWWLERWEYDGSEGWEFKTAPIKNDNLPFTFNIGCWSTIEEMMEESEE